MSVLTTRAFVIARFEFFNTVRKLSFLVTTFGLPLLLLGTGLVSAIAQSEWIRAAALDAERTALVAPVDALPLDAELEPGVVRFASEREALAALRRRDVDAAVLLDADWLHTGGARQIGRADVSVLLRDDAGPLRSVAATLRRALAGSGVDPHRTERLVAPLVVRREQLTRQGVVVASPEEAAEAFGTVLLPMLLAAMLMSALLMASGYLVQAIAVDKETRMVEVLLASATPEELLTGKLLGLGLAGMLQFAVFSLLSGGASLVAARHFMELPPPPALALALAPAAFLLGYAFLGACMLSVGAFGTTAAEAQKLTVGFVLVAILPILFFPSFLEHPNGPLARTLTFFPFTAPIAIVLRASLGGDDLSRVEVGAALAFLALATALALRGGALLFRVGLVVHGGLPSPVAALRAALAERSNRR